MRYHDAPDYSVSTVEVLIGGLGFAILLAWALAEILGVPELLARLP